MSKLRMTYDVQCEFCGEPFRALRMNLISGNTRSCGCLLVEQRRQFGLMNVTHGNAREKAWSGAYRSYVGMLQRVTNPKTIGYKYYMGRGITVCKRWKQFANFLADMGPRPAGRSIDRIDNNRNYEPGNCRWATATQQSGNRRGYSNGS